MKKIFISTAIIFMTMMQIVMSQNISLKFKGSTISGNYVQLDSVRVDNINRSWTEALVYPDTILTLSTTGIEELQKDINNALVAYPNPFNGTTNVFLTLLQSEVLTLQVYNIAGQRIMEKSLQVEAGEHHFDIHLDRPQMYFLVASTADGKSVQKLINIGRSSENSIVYIGAQEVVVPNKTLKRQSTKEFHIGDALKMIGYITYNGNVIASNEILQPQTESESLTLFFTLSNGALPTLTTTAVCNITSTSATSGGQISADGGSAIIARGVCWDTIHNPTINGSHTTDGSDIGNFTSNLTNLTSNTTYYVRAYAINSAGTAYGNEVSFNTASTMKNAQFSVSDTQKVYFSPGNLQWSATNGGSTPTTHTVAYNDTAAGTWRFAPNQWDTIGVGNNNISSTYTGWIDLFSWGTSGYNNAYPYMNTKTATTCGNENNDISETYFDWGVYNAIYNPKTNTTDAPDTWRTLTKDEWNFLLFTRTTLSGIRFAKSVVNGVVGLIVLPDDWITTIYNLSNVNSLADQYNYIDSVSWGELENVGCVFLPAAGDYYWNSNSYARGVLSYNSSTYGSYGWWSLLYSVNNYGYGLFEWYYTQEYGSSVRLVQDVNKPILPKIKPVTLTTQSVIFISDTSVMGRCTITNSGGENVTARGVCWSTSPNPTINDNHTSDSSGIGSFTSHITGLTARTTYYVRAYAINAVGTAYGNQIVFTVAPSKSFSVSDSTFVCFSPGNLQWSATNGGNTATTHAVAGNGTAAGTWRFAPNQWDKIGSTNSSISSTYTGWIDLFGWGTSGYNNKYPYMTATIDSLYGNGNNHIAGTNYDCGVYNAIYNPKTNTTDAPGTWRTLTKDEWVYLLNTRSTASSIRYAKATVMGVEGLIIVPDNWSNTYYPLINVNTSGWVYTSNIIGATDWAKMEAVGCVFLPAAGYRNGTSVNSVGSLGYYWSTTCYNSNLAYPYYLNFNSSDLYPSSYGYRYNGISVRLVRDVK